MKKRILSLLLCIVMCLSLMPMTAFATGTEEVGGKTLPYSFDFETDMTAEGWTTIDADGDEYDWRTDTDALWDEKLGIDEGHCAISRSYVNNVGPRNADNWLFSPAITIPADGAIVSWYEQSQDASYPDFYEVYVSETNTSTDTSKMTKIFSGTAANPWNQRSVELEAAEYAGKTVYIAFRHRCYDCYILEIDDFAVGAEAPAHTHTVTFDANGGSVTPTSAETGTDGKLATLPTPTRSGYSFDGWYTMKEGGTEITAEKVYTADTAIYAHWVGPFSFAHLPKTGVTNITVPAGDYYTGLAAKDAFILYWDENINTDGNFILIDYVDTYNNNNGYHAWTITIENGVPVATDGGFAEYYTTLDLINNMPFYASYDKWVNGTYSAIHTHAFTYTANNGKITATCVDGCDDGYDTNPLTLTLTAPASLVYNGNAKAFTFADGEAAAWTGAGLELPIITYAAKSGSSLTSDKAVDAGSYTASVTVDTDKTASLDFEITKATPYIKTPPAPNEIEYGQKLADSALVDGYVHISSTDSPEVAGLFEWTNPDTVPGIDDSEVTLYDVTFTPVDTNNYNTASCQVTITVNHTHNPKLVNGQAPQKGIAGWKDYYECTCGERYEDASGSILIPDLAVWKAEGGNGSLPPLIPAMYTVTFNMGNHGTQIDPQTVEEGNKATKPSDPTADGYTFDGWYADATFSVTFNFDTAINANTTIYAKWTENTDPQPHAYTIVAGANSEWTEGGTAGLLIASDAPFAKFSSVKIDGSTIAASNYIAEEGSTKITLAPAYLETLSVGTHSIEIVSNDGSVSTNFTIKATVPPVPTSYTVTFNMNGHGTQITAQTVESGFKATKPADPKASGYTFGGWYADATFSKKFDFNTAITANTTVYAKWTKNSAAPADPTSPQTGDTSNMFLWIALLLVSGGALVGTTVYGKKRKRAE